MLNILRQTPRQLQRPLFLLNFQIIQQTISVWRYEICTFSSKSTFTNLLNPLLSISKTLSNKSVCLDNGDILVETKTSRIPRVKQNDLSILEDNVLCDNIAPGQHSNIMEKIKSASNMNNLLLCYIEHAESINEKHLVEMFNMLDRFALKGEVNLSLLKKNKIYRMLCNQLEQNTSQLSTDDVLKVLTCMIRIKVSVKSHFFETIIQNISQNIKKLNERDLVFLDHLLSKLPPIRMVKNAQTLCNLEYRLKYEFLILSDLSSILHDCIESGGGYVGKILTEIYEHGSLNVNDPVKELLGNLMYAQKKGISLDRDSCQKINTIMSECLEILSKHIMQLNTEELLTVLSHMCQMNHVKFPCKYSLSFPNAVVRFALNNNLPVDVNMQICVKLMALNYASVSLCNHTIEQVVKHPNECLNASINILPFLHLLACCSRQNPHLASVLDILMEHKQIKGIRKDFTKDYFSLMYVLLMLNYYEKDLFMNVTNDEFLSKFLKQYPEAISNLQLLRIDHALSTLNSSIQRVPDVFLEQGRKLISELRVKYSMSYTLLRQIMAPEVVASNVYTPEGLHIDHILVLDQNSCPQKLVYQQENGKCVNIKDVYAADYHRVIAIVDVHPMRVFSPDDLISGTVYMKEKVLQNTGYHVVVLLQPLLHRLPKEKQHDVVIRVLRTAGVFIS